MCVYLPLSPPPWWLDAVQPHTWPNDLSLTHLKVAKPSLADLIFSLLSIKVNFKCVSVSQTDLVHFNFLRCCFFLSLSRRSARSHGSASLLSKRSRAKSAQLRLHAETGHLWIAGLCQGKHTSTHTTLTGRTAALTAPPAGEQRDTRPQVTFIL